jgi:hypothetical protein
VAYLGTTALTTVGTPTPTSMVATVPAASMATAGAHQITVKDGATTAIGSCAFTVTAAPILTVICPLQPASVLINAGPTTVTVKGTLFTAASIVMLDGVDQATTFVDASTLTFSVPASATPVTYTVSVKDGANTAAATCPFQITATPLLTVVCPVAPATAVAGSTTPLTVTVNGTNFTNTTVATADGVDQTTTFISATQISFPLAIPATVAAIQTIQIGAKDGAATAATTCPFQITPLAVVRPTLTSVWPDLIGIDDAVKTVTVTGTGFDASSVAICTQTDMATTFVSPTQLTFVTQSPMWTNGTMTLRVRNGGTPAGLSTNSLDFAVYNNPTLNMLDPATAPANVATTIKILGSGFGAQTTATVGGVEVPTVIQSGGWLDITVGPSTPGAVLQVSVHIGHPHTQGHDDVKPVVAPLSLPFTFS